MCGIAGLLANGSANPLAVRAMNEAQAYRGPDGEGLWISPDMLRRQVGFLDYSGYTVVSLQAVFDYWHGGPLPRKPVVLSFDDGFETDYSRALPILAAHGWAENAVGIPKDWSNPSVPQRVALCRVPMT